ncbi:GspH/FimT family pseudopilin [Oceanimonas baumannii]|uniref:Type II secretion system protein H n=1 Tax=Oceanimonas baumannii TaxID=129578 RepID=A0A235CE65_9GAMM|nr:GspH/FimT family pseudopilin [Oceanimonas baumannii]OYD22736.1 type II secretion system protein GspH [Oceanimonas baumannii]TDW57701.1 general secretion pathway protein H [Oceanimonas baumannii]
MKHRTWSAGSNTTGFTLLELLVVLTIATLALTVALPRFAALLPGAELKSYSRQTAALLRLARSQAIATGNIVLLTLNSEQRQTQLAEQIHAWPDGVTLTLSGTGKPQRPDAPAELTFYPDGTSSGATLLVAGEHLRYRIQVDWLTGRVYFDD